ncbi:MAG: Fic family protein [Bacteroidota bacterium]
MKLEWNFHSNSIEGNTLSFSETRSFILWGITAKGKPFRDYLEMRGHNEALNKLYEIVQKDINITENLIKEFHKLILVEPYTDKEAEINPGNWKKLPNYLYSPTGERIDFVAPEEVPSSMSKLINWTNNQISPPKRKKKKYDLHPLLIAAGFHSEFIKIHPFGDGNGRMARIFSNLILMLCGYTPAIIKLDERNDYYTALNISSLDNPEQLAICLGQAVVNSLELSIKAAKGEEIEEEEDFDKELQLLNQRIQAKKIEVPLKSGDRIRKVLNLSTFPFFRKITQSIRKFDALFESRQSIILPDYLGEFIFKPKKSDPLSYLFPIKAPQKVHLEYSFINLKNTIPQLDLRLEVAYIFRKASYVIEDNISKKSMTFSYDEYISEEEQDTWIKEIRNAILTRIKSNITD